MPTPFMSALAELVKLLPQIRELCTRQGSIQEAIVTQNADPTGFRRIKVTREAQGGQSETDWFPCGRSTMFSDEPIPPVGTQVLIGLVNGDPHKPFFLRTLSNATNPPDTGQLEPTKDNTVELPGNDRKIIAGDRLKEVQGEQNETIGGDCFLTVKGKQYHIDAEFGEILVTALAEGVGTITIEASELVHLLSMSGAGVVKAEAKTLIRFEQGTAYAQMTNGTWEFGNANGQKWVMGGASGGTWRFDLAGQTLEIVNAGGATINGKQILVIGSVDNGGFQNITRGY